MNSVFSKRQLYNALIVVAFCQQTLFDFIRVAINKTPFIGYLSFLFFPLIYATLIIGMYCKNVVSKIKLADIIFIFFFIFSFYITFLLYPDNKPYIIAAFSEDILPCIPFFLLGLCFFASKETNALIGKWSSIAIFVNCLYLVYYIATRNLGSDNMYQSYLLLTNVMFAMNYAFREKKKTGIIATFAGCFYILAMGTRGPIIIVTIYLLISIWRSIDGKTWQKVVLAASIFLFLFAISFTAVPKVLLSSLSNIFTKLGFSTRIIEYLSNNELISKTTGRSDIYSEILRLLMIKPFTGYGIYGEWQFGFSTAHNMYLEILFHFGIPFGIVLLLSGIIIFIRALFCSNDIYNSDIIIMFGCLVFVQGIFGGSYLRPGVFFLIGFCLRTIRTNTNRHFLLPSIFRRNIDVQRQN